MADPRTIRLPQPSERIHVELVMTREDGSRVVLDAPGSEWVTLDWQQGNEGAGRMSLSWLPRAPWYFTDTATASTWRPGRWWRLLSKKGRLLAESSNEAEIRGFKKKPGQTVQNLWVLPEVTMWRDA